MLNTQQAALLSNDESVHQSSSEENLNEKADDKKSWSVQPLSWFGNFLGWAAGYFKSKRSQQTEREKINLLLLEQRIQEMSELNAKAELVLDQMARELECKTKESAKKENDATKILDHLDGKRHINPTLTIIKKSD